MNIDIAIHGIDKIEQLVVGKINVLNVWREGVNLELGKNDDVVGSYAIKSFVAATKALKMQFKLGLLKSLKRSKMFKVLGSTSRK